MRRQLSPDSLPRGLAASAMLQRRKMESKTQRAMSNWLKEFFILGCIKMNMETTLPTRPNGATRAVRTPFTQNLQERTTYGRKVEKKRTMK